MHINLAAYWILLLLLITTMTIIIVVIIFYAILLLKILKNLWIFCKACLYLHFYLSCPQKFYIIFLKATTPNSLYFSGSRFSPWNQLRPPLPSEKQPLFLLSLVFIFMSPTQQWRGAYDAAGWTHRKRLCLGLVNPQSLALCCLQSKRSLTNYE